MKKTWIIGGIASAILLFCGFWPGIVSLAITARIAAKQKRTEKQHALELENAILKANIQKREQAEQ